MGIRHHKSRQHPGRTGGNALRQGIIGLVNQGQPRKPDDWGALRAWGWGVGRLIDYFESNPDSNVDRKKWGSKAYRVTARRPGNRHLTRVLPWRWWFSGEGGAKLHRHDYGEAVENLTGGEYYWMAGNFIKYGASEINGKSMNATDLPVDSHELIALCAPRPCFISEGEKVRRGLPKWIDHPGSYRAGILASKVYELLGAKGYGSDIQDLGSCAVAACDHAAWGANWPSANTHGGHTDGPNIASFFDWVGKHFKSPAASCAIRGK